MRHQSRFIKTMVLIVPVPGLKSAQQTHPEHGMLIKLNVINGLWMLSLEGVGKKIKQQESESRKPSPGKQ
jgi:hypothetical protein